MPSFRQALSVVAASGIVATVAGGFSHAASCLTAIAGSNFCQGTPASGDGEPTPRFGTLIDFDDGVDGSAVAEDAYQGQGVASITYTETYSGSAALIYGGWSGQSTPNQIQLVSDDGFDFNIPGSVTFELTALANTVGIGVLDGIGGPETITIYGAGKNQLDTLDLGGPGINYEADGSYYIYIMRSDYDVKYLTIAGEYFGLDDLQFTEAAVVPLPPAGLLLLGALGALGMVWRRRT